jgi:hypothetical protein
MKHYFLFLILLCTASIAQNKPVFGINVGGTYANIRGNVAANKNDYKPNFLVGGSIEIPINERFSFLGNINYERKTFGQKLEVSPFEGFDPIVNSRNVDYDVRLEYLTIPMNIKYYMDSQKRFFVNGGLFAGIFLASSSKADGRDTYDDESGLFKAFDFGLNFGLGTKIKVTEKHNMNLELRHNLGLSNISERRTINDKALKTNSFNLIANWQFN